LGQGNAGTIPVYGLGRGDSDATVVYGLGQGDSGAIPVYGLGQGDSSAAAAGSRERKDSVESVIIYNGRFESLPSIRPKSCEGSIFFFKFSLLSSLPIPALPFVVAKRLPNLAKGARGAL